MPEFLGVLRGEIVVEFVVGGEGHFCSGLSGMFYWWRGEGIVNWGGLR